MQNYVETSQNFINNSFTNLFVSSAGKIEGVQEFEIKFFE